MFQNPFSKPEPLFPGVRVGRQSPGDERGGLTYLLEIHVTTAACGKGGVRRGGKEGHSTGWREAWASCLILSQLHKEL